MRRLKEYMIGRFLLNEDVFEQARAIMLYQFSIMFTIVFMLPIATDILMGLDKVLILHSLAVLVIIAFPVIVRNAPSLDWAINFFFVISFITSVFTFMILNPLKIDAIGITWSVVFLYLSVLMQRGKGRLWYCLLFSWLPIGYVVTNIFLGGTLTVNWLFQPGGENPPTALVLIPVSIGVYAIWRHTVTIKHAQQTITMQKEVIQEKNKSIEDSMRYASGIQKSLLPTETYIEKTLNRMNKK